MKRLKNQTNITFKSSTQKFEIRPVRTTINFRYRFSAKGGQACPPLVGILAGTITLQF